ncbi:MAG: peptide ABC transporter substrate-binding protein [Bacillota bacterium]|nr:peptide ABC transporter substrate-binding protein [Bacillota bacterium]
MSRKISGILILIILCTSLASCGMSVQGLSKNSENTGSQQSQNGDSVLDKGPVQGGTINLFTTVPDSLNPILSSNLYVQSFSRFVYEGLFKTGKDQSAVPELCDKWEVSPDGLTWTFHIRENVMWQDNIQLTAEDVEFTVSTILNPAIKSIYKTNLQNVLSFAAIDRNNFRMVLKKADSFTPESLIFPIISKHSFSGEDVANSQENMKPMGTGPYKFISYDGKTVKFVVNEAWWGLAEKKDNSPRKPYISEIDVKVYKNSSDALNALQSKNIDVAFSDALESSRYNGNASIAIKKYPGRNFDYIAFNMTKPVTADKSVRQAIAYTLDKNRIINDVASGGATESQLPIFPNSWLGESLTYTYTHDVNKAKEVLSQNGWKVSNGVNYKNINGVYRELTLNLLVNDDNETRSKIADDIKAQLAEAGINVNIQKLPFDQEFKQISSKQYDIAIVGVSSASRPDLSFEYASSEIATGKNIAGYSNTQVDSLLGQILNTNDNQNKKMSYSSLNNIINDEIPYIGLFYYDNAVLYNKRIKGDLSPYYADLYNDITGWYIPG